MDMEETALYLMSLYMLSFFQYFMTALAHHQLERGENKASHHILWCIDLGNILHSAAPRRVTCYSDRKIRIVRRRKLPVVSEVFGNGVSGVAAVSSSSSCCVPISPLHCLPKPQNGCCRTHSYMCRHILAAYDNGTYDTCPVVFNGCCEPTTPTTTFPFEALPDAWFPYAHGHISYGLCPHSRPTTSLFTEHCSSLALDQTRA